MAKLSGSPIPKEWMDRFEKDYDQGMADVIRDSGKPTIFDTPEQDWAFYKSLPIWSPNPLGFYGI